MTVSDEVLAVGAEFPAASREQWQRLVTCVLAKSGKPGLAGPAAERALATEVEDGLWVQPLYTAEDACLIPRGLIPRGPAPAGPASRRSPGAAGRGPGSRQASPAGTSGSITRTPIRGGRTRRCSRTWRTASPRCG